MFVRRNTRRGNPRGEKYPLTSLLLALSSQSQMASCFLNSFASSRTPDFLHIPSYLPLPLLASFTWAENTFLSPRSQQLFFSAEDTKQLNGQAVGLNVQTPGNIFLHAIHFHSSIHPPTHSLTHPFICNPSVHPSIYHPFIQMSTHPSSILPLNSLSIYISIHTLICLSIHLSTHLSV